MSVGLKKGSDMSTSSSNLRKDQDSYYAELKQGRIRIKVSDSKYRCPYCYEREKKDYQYKELLRHASRIGRSPRSASIREIAKHLALERYVDKYLRVENEPQPVSKHMALERTERYVDKYIHEPQPVSKMQCDDPDQLLVWPWMGIVANIKTEIQGGRRVGESGSKLREEFTRQGFNPLKVHPLWNRYGHSGFAIVEFDKDWTGFKNAIMFEKSFEVNHCGKKDYYVSRDKGEKLYGWVARNDDYNSRSIFGDHLRKNGDLKTVSGLEAEVKSKDLKLVSNLTNTLETKNLQLKEIKDKFMETSSSRNHVVEQVDEMVRTYNDEIRTMQQYAHDHFKHIVFEQKRVTIQLEAQKKKLEERENQLLHREAHNDNERKKLYEEKEMNAMATLEQKKADDKVLRLAEEQQREKEKLHKKIIELEKKLDARQALELEIERLKGSLEVMKHMGEDDEDAKKKMDDIQQELDEKKDELDYYQNVNQSLIVKERRTNDEVQDARKELIILYGAQTQTTRTYIGVKRMGDLDSKPFCIAAKAKYDKEEADQKALELCSHWEDQLRDPNWHPFRIIEDNGQAKEIIDENDQMLRDLKNDLGDEVYKAVITAVMEMNAYNPSGRYTVPEVWNFKEGRKATLKEAVAHVLKQWRMHKRRKN